MGGTSKKNTKAKPAKLTEFFPTSSQSQNPQRELTYPPSPASSSRPGSVDFEQRDTLGSGSSSELLLQKMFHSFREDLQGDFRHIVSEFKADMQALLHRTEHVEAKMGEFAASHNLLIDSHTALEEEVHKLSAKIQDLEDRSRRNNIRLRGIPESVTSDQLQLFLTDLMALVLPACASNDLTIDRIHRIPKPKHLPASIARDVIARVHFFQIKEQFLKALRAHPELPDRFRNISIFPDLSAATMLRRKEFSQCTRILRDSCIPYRWAFPVKLIILKDDSQLICSTPDMAKQALISWNLLPLADPSPKRKLPPRPAIVTPLWSEKTRRTRAPDPD